MAILKLIITFATAPSSAVATMATQKFNKLGFICPQFDDGSPGAKITRDNIFPAFTYTDGTGGLINYRGDMALNGNFSEGQSGYDPTYITPAGIRELIGAGWNMTNHSLTHGGLPSRYDDLSQLDVRLFNDTGYYFNDMAIPGADAGFSIAARDYGYRSIFATSDATFDGIPGTHKILPTTLTTGEFFCFVRDFDDTWWEGDQPIDYYKEQHALFLTGERNFHIHGTHAQLLHPEEQAGYRTVWENVKTVLQDRVAVCPAREATEYRQMRKLPMTQVLSGNTLTVSFDTATLPERTRWRDVSLNLATAATITGVTVEGFDRASYNQSTKLVNGFLQKMTWDGSVIIPTDPTDPTDPTNPGNGDPLNVPHGRFYI